MNVIDEIATENSEYGYQLSNKMDTRLATDVLEEALRKYPKPKIFNSDQGSRYTSIEYTQKLKDSGIEISMKRMSQNAKTLVIARHRMVPWQSRRRRHAGFDQHQYKDSGQTRMTCYAGLLRFACNTQVRISSSATVYEW